MPGTSRVAAAVGWVTFLEVIRDKVLYNVLLCAFLLFGVGYLASRLTFVRPERVVLDFGLTAINISCSLVAALAGASLLGREFERRTVYVAFSRPISRGQFTLGKYAGIAGVLLCNWLLFTAVYAAMLAAAGGQPGAVFSVALAAALSLVLLQSLVVAGVAILFSTISTTSLTVIMTLGVYLIGNNISELRALEARIQSPAARGLLHALTFALPDLEYFNLGTKVTYGMPVSAQLFATSLAYGAALIAICLLLSGFLVRGREV